MVLIVWTKILFWSSHHQPKDRDSLKDLGKCQISSPNFKLDDRLGLFSGTNQISKLAFIVIVREGTQKNLRKKSHIGQPVSCVLL